MNTASSSEFSHNSSANADHGDRWGSDSENEDSDTNKAPSTKRARVLRNIPKPNQDTSDNEHSTELVANTQNIGAHNNLDAVGTDTVDTTTNTGTGTTDSEDVHEQHPFESKRKPPLSVGNRNYVPLWQGCRDIDCYERSHRVGRGTYGDVYLGKCKETGDLVALKAFRCGVDSSPGLSITTVREINVLMCLRHPNVVQVREVCVTPNFNTFYAVMEYCPQDLKTALNRAKTLRIAEVKCFLLQILSGLAYIHRNWIVHRDMKPSNILINDEGCLKICDFGCARKYGDPLRRYTPGFVTLAYRSPELLLGASVYGPEVDIWSAGCIFAELMTSSVLFYASNEAGMLRAIFSVLGSPTKKDWPGIESLPFFKRFGLQQYTAKGLRSKIDLPSFPLGGSTQFLTDTGLDLLSKMLQVNPANRISAQDALQHQWFKEAPLPADPKFITSFACGSD